MKTTALIFASGKVVITGAKSEDDAYQATKMYASMVSKVTHVKVSFKEEDFDFKIQNIVGSHAVGFQVRLGKLYMDAQSSSRYEPE